MLYLSQTGGRPNDFWSLSAFEWSSLCAASAAAAPAAAEPMTRAVLERLIEEAS